MHVPFSRQRLLYSSCHVQLDNIAAGPPLSVAARGDVYALPLTDACEVLSYRLWLNAVCLPAATLARPERPNTSVSALPDCQFSSIEPGKS